MPESFRGGVAPSAPLPTRGSPIRCRWPGQSNWPAPFPPPERSDVGGGVALGEEGDLGRRHRRAGGGHSGDLPAALRCATHAEMAPITSGYSCATCLLLKRSTGNRSDSKYSVLTLSSRNSCNVVDLDDQLRIEGTEVGNPMSAWNLTAEPAPTALFFKPVQTLASDTVRVRRRVLAREPAIGVCRGRAIQRS